MQVDQQPDEPCRTRKVGADSAGQIAIGGYLYAHDFPEVVDELRAGHGALGMSYEIADAIRGESGVADLDGDFVHIYRGGGVAAGEGSVPGDVDRGGE